MMSVPKVSVVVTLFNCEEYIKECLDSILDQQCSFSIEIIVGEDCSTDSSRAILERYAELYPEVVVPIYNGKNLGICANFSSAVSCARGEYIAFCDADDYWHNPEKLQRQVEFLEDDAECVMVYSNANILNEESGSLLKNCYQLKDSSAPSGYIYEQLMRKNFIIASSPCSRAKEIKETCKEISLKNHSWMLQDYPLWLAVSLKGRVGYFDEAMITYRIRSGSLSSVTSIKRVNLKYSVWKIREYFLSVHGVPPELQEIILQDGGNRTVQYLFWNKRYDELREFVRRRTLPISSRRAKLIAQLSVSSSFLNGLQLLFRNKM